MNSHLEDSWCVLDPPKIGVLTKNLRLLRPLDTKFCADFLQGQGLACPAVIPCRQSGKMLPLWRGY
jgi:hypothetical protein